MLKIYVNDFNPITFLLYQSKSVDWHVIAFCVIITRGKNRVVKSIRLAIGCIPDGSESLTDTFLWALSFCAGRVLWICVRL